MDGGIGVLIVEDEVLSARYLRRLLDKIGFRIVATTASGEEAVRLAELEKPDLILMDISLEGSLDGIAAARKIKESASIPIVFLTGYSDGDIRARAEQMHPVAFIVKPVDLNALKKAIGSLLGER